MATTASDSTPEPKPYAKIQSPYIHWQEPDDRGYVIGGVSGFQPLQAPHAAKAEEAKPELQFSDAREMTAVEVPGRHRDRILGSPCQQSRHDWYMLFFSNPRRTHPKTLTLLGLWRKARVWAEETRVVRHLRSYR
jgi:hypothetical protein